MTSSSNMSGKVRASTKVAPPSSTPKPVAPRQQTSMTPGASNSLGGRVRPLTKVAIPAPEVRGHAPPTPYPYNRQTASGGDTGSHISDPIRAELGKLERSIRAGIRRAADAK
jgi:hypothetical protein